MTCVVGYELGNGKALLGCDSFMGNGMFLDSFAGKKFFQKGPKFAIGFAGTIRGAQLVEHAITFRKLKKGESEEAFLVNEVSLKIQHAFNQVGVNVKSPDHADSHDAEFIVALNGKIFIIQEDYSVCRSSNGFTAIGAGAMSALGALAALSANVGKSSMTPKARVNAALEASAKISPMVAGPFHFIEV